MMEEINKEDIGLASREDTMIADQYVGSLHTSNSPITGDSIPPVFDSYGHETSLGIGTETVSISGFAFNIQTLVDITHPIGSIIVTIDNTEPNIPHSVWELDSDSSGKYIAGVGSNTDSTGTSRTFSQGVNYGLYNHTLSVSEIPSHSHRPIGLSNSSFTYFAMYNRSGRRGRQEGSDDSNQTYGFENAFYTGSIDSAGSNQSHENCPPRFGMYIWKRTS